MSRSTTLRSLCLKVVVAVPALLSLPAAAQQPIGIDKVVHVGGRSEEIAFTVSARVQGLRPEQLARCIARADGGLHPGVSPRQTFARVRWTEPELAILRDCRAGGCKYELSGPMARQLADAPSLAEKKNVYYRLVHEATVRANKRGKQNRIRPADLRSLPGACARHGGLYWLLDGQLKPHDRLVWRKVHASQRMRPTLLTMQHHDWLTGSSVCVGKTLLFADHYYDDHLELFELRPAGSGRTQLTYHVRSRFDFFGSWWARRFKDTIASRLVEHTTEELQRMVTRCARASLVAKR